MAEETLERKELAEETKWDLSSLFASDAEFEEILGGLEAQVSELAGFEGRLKDAESIASYLTKETELGRTLSNLFSYASMRRDEDTREEAAQSMYARIYGAYVKAETKTAFATPEILSLPDEVLEGLATASELKGYRYRIQNLIKEKAHTLTGEQEALLASFGEVFAAPREIAVNLMNADLVFDSVADAKGDARGDRF